MLRQGCSQTGDPGFCKSPRTKDLTGSSISTRALVVEGKTIATAEIGASAVVACCPALRQPAALGPRPSKRRRRASKVANINDGGQTESRLDLRLLLHGSYRAGQRLPLLKRQHYFQGMAARKDDAIASLCANDSSRAAQRDCWLHPVCVRTGIWPDLQRA